MKKGFSISATETAQWDESFAKVLAETQPALYEQVAKAVAGGESPAKIERFVKAKCPAKSIIPNLVRHAAEHEKRKISN